MTLDQIIKEAENSFDERYVIRNSGWRETGMTSDYILNNLITPASLKSFLTEQIKLAVEKALEETKIMDNPVLLRQDGVSYDYGAVEGWKQAVAEQAKKIEEFKN